MKMTLKRGCRLRAEGYRELFVYVYVDERREVEGGRREMSVIVNVNVKMERG